MQQQAGVALETAASDTEKKSRIIKGLMCVLITAVMLLLPVPQGLTLLAWRVLAIYLGAVFGICLRPVPEPVVLLAALSVVSIWLKQFGMAMAAFSEST